MLIGCITGPDFETAKRQIEKANFLCDGVELRADLLECDLDALTSLVRGKIFNCDDIPTYHNFEETPEDLEGCLAAMPAAPLYKIATMANSSLDALRMLIFAKRHPNVIALCMGEMGKITRILAPVVSNPVNFAAIEKIAAPGQLTAEELIEIYNYKTLSPKTKIYGLIGNPVSHSLGHKFHNQVYAQRGIDAVYVKMRVAQGEIPAFFSLAKELGISGLSVTMPLKEKVFDEIDVLDPDAKEIGAVNTLTFEAGKVYGQNTDASGALDAVEEHLPVNGRSIVILGAGGASKAIAFEAKKRGAVVNILSRRFGNLNTLLPYDILINTTPVEVPIDLSQLHTRKVVMDITVRHACSPLMVRAKALGCRIVYGQTMFEKQALSQIERWFTRCYSSSL